MTPSTGSKRQQEWLTEFERRLEQCIKDGKHDILVDYRSVSQSFPGGPHPDYFEVPLIEWGDLNDWARNHGWSAIAAPESTHQDQQSTPQIRFTRQDAQ